MEVNIMETERQKTVRILESTINMAWGGFFDIDKIIEAGKFLEAIKDIEDTDFEPASDLLELQQHMNQAK